MSKFENWGTVCATPMTSLPERLKGNDADCIAVGVENPLLCRAILTLTCKGNSCHSGSNFAARPRVNVCRNLTIITLAIKLWQIFNDNRLVVGSLSMPCFIAVGVSFLVTRSFVFNDLYKSHLAFNQGVDITHMELCNTSTLSSFVNDFYILHFLKFEYTFATLQTRFCRYSNRFPRQIIGRSFLNFEFLP